MSKIGRPRRQKPGGTRERIANSFVQICYEFGPEAVTLKIIASRSELTLAAVRYQFPGGIDEIRTVAFKLVAINGRTYTDTRMATVSSLSAMDQLLEYVNATFDWFIQNRSYGSFWIYSFFELSRSKEGTSFLKAKQDAASVAHARILQILMQESHQFDVKLIDGLENLAMELHSLLIGFAIQASANPTTPSWNYWRKLAMKSFSRPFETMV